MTHVKHDPPTYTCPDSKRAAECMPPAATSTHLPSTLRAVARVEMGSTERTESQSVDIGGGEGPLYCNTDKETSERRILEEKL